MKGLPKRVGAALLFCAARAWAQTPSLGIFEGQSGVGTLLQPGTAVFDVNTKIYSLTGSGENMWAAEDDFQFAWKKHSGDIALAANIAFPEKTGNEHKKAVLMIRQDLDGNSTYVDVAVHVNGLTSLQSRDTKGGNTHEVGIDAASPTRVRLEKRGDYFFMYLDEHLAGGSMRLSLTEPFYVGIGVCAHDKNSLARAEFSKVELGKPETAQSKLYSTLETVTVTSTDRRVVSVFPERVEAPNWAPDGKSLIFNTGGRLKRIALAGGAIETIDTGTSIQCNNDHGIAPDGTQLAISDRSREGGKSAVYVLSLGGGTPRLVTTNKSDSFWHGWSPDGKTLVFTGNRDGKFDIYSIPAAGGEETRLTHDAGHNDGPEYSPDGALLYFNSDRGGSMQIWRMKADGSEAEQVLRDETNDWFPHLSPDGKQMVFLSYEKGVNGHPANKDVTLRVMTLTDQRVKILAKLFGGQGTINVPSWSPDSRRVAFVSYQLVP